MYPCNQCEYAATNHSTLKQHKESQHEGVRYACDECSYSTSDPSHLAGHKILKHKQQKRYPCDQCDFEAKTLAGLNKHKDYKHEPVGYACETSYPEALFRETLSTNWEDSEIEQNESLDDPLPLIKLVEPADTSIRPDNSVESN